VAKDNSPALRQRELGKQLRELRNPRGLTVEDVAQCLEWSATKISRLETGLRCAILRDVRDLCDLYTVSKPGCVKLMALAREARKRGWWTEYDDLILDPFSGAGNTAVSGSLMIYYVPALLQTEEYARKIIGDIEPTINVNAIRRHYTHRSGADPDVSRRGACDRTVLGRGNILRRWARTGICYRQVQAPSNWQRYRIERE
jgi:transcriptional regulator with XRE-family HTH domain